MSARPAATLHAPTPAFRIDVGYSSAVYTGIIVLPALIVNLPVERIRGMQKVNLEEFLVNPFLQRMRGLLSHLFQDYNQRMQQYLGSQGVADYIVFVPILHFIPQQIVN